MQHVALYNQHKLFACSDQWQTGIHQTDKNMLHLLLLIFEHKLADSNFSIGKQETPVYLTHTGIINETGKLMAGTIGKYAYNFVCLPLDQKNTLCLLCNDSLQIEQVMQFVNEEISRNDFLLKVEKKPAIELPENHHESIAEWILIGAGDSSLRSFTAYQAQPKLASMIKKFGLDKASKSMSTYTL